MENKLYTKYIKKCISLARKGEGNVSPNPLVGAVVLDKYGNIAGYGYHQKYGQPHAEVNAIKMAEKNGINIKGGTIFVSLEPCSHFGKTPPCADLIIEKGLKKVVTGCIDPNPKVAGNGIKKLKDAGIEVVCGVLEQQCRNLNEIFIKNQIEKRPFIAIKTAVTADGKIAAKTGDSKWITSEKARACVQKLRNKYDAILTGSGTVIADNPSLTCRMKNGTDNVKILKCPPDPSTGKIDLNILIQKLFDFGIMSVIIEAGGTLNGAFLKTGRVDKIYQFIAPKILGDNSAKSFVEGFDIPKIDDCLKFEVKKVKKFKPDILLVLNAIQ